MLKIFLQQHQKTAVFQAWLGIACVALVSGECTTKRFTFTGVDDLKAISALQKFLEEQIQNGGTVSIETEVTKAKPSSARPPRTNTAELLPPDALIETSESRHVASISAAIPRDCRNIAPESAKSRNNTGGVFDIDVINIGVTEVYCDMTTDNGGWIVFQRRMNGNLDFNRNWTEYVNGFGNVGGEFWLGLEKIDKLTNSGDCELRIDMISTHGERYYAKYSLFKVSTASDNYRLTVSGYSGNATDSFKTHNNKPFSTFDKDNDAAPFNCAGTFLAGWWFDNCQLLNLKWFFGNAGRIWPVFRLNDRVYLDFIEMKLRKKN